ncbi:hypothetical protein WJ90_22755 [Burkholderia ubonensis]|nr:hypothetical protein WJ90_22755 [Burkholderia ubonensis]KVR58314.1 hypothetical protein WK16_22590 [Burkholderia ubonensis]
MLLRVNVSMSRPDLCNMAIPMSQIAFCECLSDSKEKEGRFMKELLGELFDALGVGSAIAAEGCCALVFDGELVVNIEVQEQESRVLFTGQLAPLPEHLSIEQARQLMALNLALARYHRMSMGLEAHSGQLVLCHDVDVSQASLPTLETALAQLLRQVELCRKMLHQPDWGAQVRDLSRGRFFRMRCLRAPQIYTNVREER